jgi:formate dehydrogenase major subunit
VPIEGSEEIMEFDTIIPAIGQEPDMACIEGEQDTPETTRWNTFVYDEVTQTTNIDGVFAAGDCAFGPDILIRAIAEGRRAAQAMDLYLDGSPVTLTKPYAISRGRLAQLNSDDFSPRFEHKKRALETTHPADVRLANGGYDPINVGLDNVQAVAEATRCIECGCSARFDCDLRQYASDYDSSEKILGGEKRQYAEDKRHPLIRIEADKCITCASCVRICSEVREISALSFIQRGFVTRIGPNFDDPLQDTGCDACGMCTDVCPTGAITPNTGKEAGPWIWLTKSTSCTACDRGCGINVHTQEGRVVKVQSINSDSVNGAVICAEGRFSYQLLNQEITASELDKVKQTLTAATSKSIVVSPRLTVEQTFASAQLAKSLGASLNYLPGEASEATSNTKVAGEANLALLKRLGASPLNGADYDCVVSVGSGISRAQAGNASIIALATPGATSEADHTLPMADPISIDGAFLNRDGDLAILNGSIKDPQDQAGLSALASLADSAELADLDKIRASLANEVPELKALTNLNGDRLVSTDLAPELDGVAPDAREIAFISHMESIGLS